MPPTVWIRASALTYLTVEAADKTPLETGGVLLGWENRDYREIVVVRALGPGPGATHDRTSFHPDGDWHDSQVADAYERSGRIITYLGDWHTHPRGTTTLSPRDVHTLTAIARNPEARAPRPLMAVLAGGEPWTLDVWQSEMRKRWHRRARISPREWHVWTA